MFIRLPQRNPVELNHPMTACIRLLANHFDTHEAALLEGTHQVMSDSLVSRSPSDGLDFLGGKLALRSTAVYHGLHPAGNQFDRFPFPAFRQGPISRALSGRRY